jgi:hypothetical protein
MSRRMPIANLGKFQRLQNQPRLKQSTKGKR